MSTGREPSQKWIELFFRMVRKDMEATLTTDSLWECDLMPAATVSDEQLLMEYRRTGDREVFARLVYRYERELYNYLHQYLCDGALAEDVFQTTFLQVHLKCSQFEVGRRFRPWLYAIATNQAIDARRRNKRHRMVSLDQAANGSESEDLSRLADVLMSTDADPGADAERAEQNRIVRETLDNLPESMLAVIQLVYFQGLKYREAADILGVPVGTVKSRLHAAIAKLTEAWKTIQPENQ